jgi:hypothetical protein
VSFTVRLQIDEVEVVPAVAFAHPDEFVGVVEVLDEGLVVVVEESLAFLVHHRGDFPGLGVDREKSHNGVAALVVAEVEARAVAAPVLVADGPGVGEEFIRHRDFLLRLDVEEVRLGERDRVAGLQVVVGRGLGLHLVARG